MVRRIIRALRLYLGLHFLRVFMVRLDDAPALPQEQSGLRYAALTEPELLAWCRDGELELEEAKVLAALRRGDICIGALHGNRLVGYVWFAFGNTPHVAGSWVRVERSTRYLYKAFVRPGCRRRGFASQMYAAASALCPRRGRVLGTLAVEADNTAGLRTPRRAGWRGIGYAGFVRCLGRVLVFRSYGALRYGFALFVPGENGQVARAPRLAAEETTGGFVAKTTR